jgi:hypothetical protein
MSTSRTIPRLSANPSSRTSKIFRKGLDLIVSPLPFGYRVPSDSGYTIAQVHLARSPLHGQRVLSDWTGKDADLEP